MLFFHALNNPSAAAWGDAAGPDGVEVDAVVDVVLSTGAADVVVLVVVSEAGLPELSSFEHAAAPAPRTRRAKSTAIRRCMLATVARTSNAVGAVRR